MADFFDDTPSAEEANFFEGQRSFSENDIGDTAAEERRKIAEWEYRQAGKDREYTDDNDNDVVDEFEALEEAEDSFTPEDYRQELEPQARQQAMNLSQAADNVSAAREQLAQRLQGLMKEDGTLRGIPDRNKDPLGYLMQKQEIDEINRFASQIQAAEQQTMQAAQQMIFSQEEAYAKTHTDYYDAFDYLKKSVLNQFLAAGMTPEQAEQQFTAEAHRLAYESLDAGRNPAKAVMSLAKARGFSKARNASQKIKAMASKPESIQSLIDMANKRDVDAYEKEFIKMFGNS